MVGHKPTRSGDLGMWAIVLEHPDVDPVDIEWVSTDELDAWQRVVELARRMRREAGFVSARRDVWITSWGSLREGLTLRFVLGSNEAIDVRIGLEFRPDWLEPEPFGDDYEPG